MQRAVIIAKGDVQRVGYRDVVEKTARKLNLVGYVENLKPYDVRIIAEGEKEQIETFIEKIQIKEAPIFVENISVGYEKPTGEFKYFEIKRGKWQEELGERLDTAGAVMYEIRDLQKSSLDKQDQTIQEIKTVGNKVDSVGSKVDALRDETKQEFNRMDTKYDKVSDKLDKIDKTLERLTDAILSVIKSK